MLTMDKNKLPFVDLHVHTCYSDGTQSPRSVVEEAYAMGVGVLSIADHESFEGSIEAEIWCKQKGIRLICAAELECLFCGIDYHVLCYGADLDNGELRKMADKNRVALDRMSDVLIERLSLERLEISIEDYVGFEDDAAAGGWKGIRYLHKRGVTQTLREGIKLYEQYGVHYSEAGFPALCDLLAVIHRANGVAVVAHIGYTLKHLDAFAFREQIDKLIAMGVDGFECYYPLHDEPMCTFLLETCNREGLLITAGSDAHGSFGRTHVGEMNITLDQLKLGRLIPENE